MTEKRCDECKHWQRNTPILGRSIGDGRCMLATGNDDDEYPDEAMAFAVDAFSGCPTELQTLAEFGCVLWEAKGNE